MARTPLNAQRCTRALLSLIVLCTSLAATASQTTRFLLFTGNKEPAGEQVVDRGDDGLVKVRYIFKNNGRGPELNEQFRLAPDGTLADYRVTGSAAMGAAVVPDDEHAAYTAAVARSADRAKMRFTTESLRGK